MARPGGRDGFMLLEALIALGLGALILVALLSLTGLLRKSADRAAAALETVEVSTRTLDVVAREIRAAVPRRFAATPEEKAAAARAGPAAGPGADPASPAGRPVTTAAQPRTPSAPQQGAAAPPDQNQGGPEGQNAAAGAALQNKRPFAFIGAPDRLLFVLNPVQPTGLRAPVVVVWQADEAGALLRAEAPLPVTATGPEGVRLGPVARIDPGPERFRFAFVDRQPTGDEIIVDLWADPTRLPVAIRIERIDARTGATVGMLRVPFLVDGEPGCVDPGKGACARAEGAGAPRDASGGPNGDAPAPPAGGPPAGRPQ